MSFHDECPKCGRSPMRYADPSAEHLDAIRHLLGHIVRDETNTLTDLKPGVTYFVNAKTSYPADEVTVRPGGMKYPTPTEPSWSTCNDETTENEGSKVMYGPKRYVPTGSTEKAMLVDPKSYPELISWVFSLGGAVRRSPNHKHHIILIDQDGNEAPVPLWDYIVCGEDEGDLLYGQRREDFEELHQEI